MSPETDDSIMDEASKLIDAESKRNKRSRPGTPRPKDKKLLDLAKDEDPIAMMKELVGEEHVEEDRLNIDEIIEKLMSVRFKQPGAM